MCRMGQRPLIGLAVRVFHVRMREHQWELKAVKAFPAHTGHELAAMGEHVALRRGAATQDGPMVLLDVARTQPHVRTLPSGVNPAWAE